MADAKTEFTNFWDDNDLPAPSPDDEYISVSEAVHRGYGSPSTVNRLIKIGRALSYTDGRCRMVRLNDLDAWALRRRQGVDPAQAFVDLTKQIRNVAPVLSADQKSRLADLLATA